MSTLFELTGQLESLRHTLESSDGEIPPDLLAWLEGAEGEFAAKVEAYCNVIGELEALATARKAEVDRLKALHSTTAATISRMREALRESMIRTGQTRVETVRHKVWVQAAGGAQPLNIDEMGVPERFTRTVTHTEPDREAIRKALESGESLPFACLAARGQILRIK